MRRTFGPGRETPQGAALIGMGLLMLGLAGLVATNIPHRTAFPAQLPMVVIGIVVFGAIGLAMLVNGAWRLAGTTEVELDAQRLRRVRRLGPLRTAVSLPRESVEGYVVVRRDGFGDPHALDARANGRRPLRLLSAHSGDEVRALAKSLVEQHADGPFRATAKPLMVEEDSERLSDIVDRTELPFGSDARVQETKDGATIELGHGRRAIRLHAGTGRLRLEDGAFRTTETSWDSISDVRAVSVREDDDWWTELRVVPRDGAPTTILRSPSRQLQRKRELEWLAVTLRRVLGLAPDTGEAAGRDS